MAIVAHLVTRLVGCWCYDPLPRDLLSVGVDTIDLAIGTRASYADLAVQVTLQCRQRRFENLLPYRGQGSEPYLVKLAPCTVMLTQIVPSSSGARTFYTAVKPLEITRVDHRGWIARISHFARSLRVRRCPLPGEDDVADGSLN